MAKNKYPSGLQRKYRSSLIQDILNILKYINYFYSKKIYILNYKDLDQYIVSRTLKKRIKLLFKNKEPFNIYNFIKMHPFLINNPEEYLTALFEVKQIIGGTRLVNTPQPKRITKISLYYVYLRKTIINIQEPNKKAIERIKYIRKIYEQFTLEENNIPTDMDKIIDTRIPKPNLVPTLDLIEWGDDARNNMLMYGILIGNIGIKNTIKIVRRRLLSTKTLRDFKTNTDMEKITEDTKNNNKQVTIIPCDLKIREKNTIEDILGSIE